MKRKTEHSDLTANPSSRKGERERVCVCMNLLLEREPTASMGESARAILLVRRKPNTLMPTLI
jgi:hypothetical protein